jgi:hypothetical protein
MKFKISVALNIVLFLLVLILGGGVISSAIGDFYYRKTVGIVASGAVAALERGNTNLVHDALLGIRYDPDVGALDEAGQKLRVIKVFH